MRKLSVFFAILLFVLPVRAERVSLKEAEQVARAFYHQTANAFRNTDWSDINLSCVVNPNDCGAKYNLYVFDVNGDEGYLVVASNNQITPVLAYSFECAFNMNNMSPGQAAYLDYYSESNDYADKNETEFAAKMQAEWADLLAYSPEMRATRDLITSPILLDGIVWEQGYPFNQGCPADSDGDHGHVYVGCVATATCHVMKYWNWPATGVGSKTHSSWANGGYGNITINFANQTYDWYSMPDDPSGVNSEVSKICYHVGVGVSMYWGADGSGSQTNLVKEALKNYFKYSSEVAYKSKYSYSDPNWNALLKNQIDSKYPMVYGGSSSNSGHAWNCDGYQINGPEYKFHMNWGWGAYGGNGFYTLDNLISTATVGGAENNFNQGQEVVINIHPNQEFTACTDVVVSGSEGTFDDGSRAGNYTNNKDCTYVINPTCGSYITMQFTKFDLASGDYVNVFAGDETSTNLLATYDMDNLPSSKIKSPAGAMTIRFHTDGQNVADGWKVDFKSVYCNPNGAVTLTEPSGSFGDGSKSCQYNDNANCQWKISPADATQITISFQNFNLANDAADYVGIYKNSTSNSNLVVKYNSTNIPTEPITVNASTVCVKFFSNINDLVSDGWLLSYTSSSLQNVEDINILSNLNVVPNPVNNGSKIAFTLTDASSTRLTITNIMGQIVADADFDFEPGYHEIPVSDLFKSERHSGMYFVTLQSGSQIKTCKFMFAE